MHTSLWSLGLLELDVFVSLCLCTSVCPPLSVHACVCLSCTYLGVTSASSLYILQGYTLHWVEVPGGAPDWLFQGTQGWGAQSWVMGAGGWVSDRSYAVLPGDWEP